MTNDRTPSHCHGRTAPGAAPQPDPAPAQSRRTTAARRRGPRPAQDAQGCGNRRQDPARPQTRVLDAIYDIKPDDDRTMPYSRQPVEPEPSTAT
ncbi:MAG: hypothetical protein WDN06_02355 [Asticcacaulis sp.]